MKKIFLHGIVIILLSTFFCFIYFTFQPQPMTVLVDSSEQNFEINYLVGKKLILIDPNCLEHLSRNLECELPIRIATTIEKEQFEDYEDKIKLEFVLNERQGKDFWLFQPISNASSSNGQIATKRFATVPFSSLSNQFGQNQIPQLEVPIPIHSFIKSWKRGKFFECGDGKGHPLLERKNGQKQVIPLNFLKRLAQFMELLETHNATGILMGGTLLGWRRECSIIPHTHDIDLGILREEHSEGLVRALINSFDGAYLLGHLSESLIIKFDVDGVRIDLFYIYQHPDKTNKSYVAGFRNDKRQLLFWVYPQILEFCAGEMLGHLFHFPCNFDDFIINSPEKMEIGTPQRPRIKAPSPPRAPIKINPMRRLIFPRASSKARRKLTKIQKKRAKKGKKMEMEKKRKFMIPRIPLNAIKFGFKP